MQPQYSNENSTFLSRPQLYGGFGGFNRDGKPFFVRSQRQRINLVSIFQCFFLPWGLFCLMYADMSFQIHYDRPVLCYCLCGVGLLAVVASGAVALVRVLRKLQPDQPQEPKWYLFLFLTMLIAWILAVVLGDLNFWTNMQPYYNYVNLNSYHSVNPATMRGQQLMDAGRVFFTNTTGLDLRRSMGFRNLDVYCVAPISVQGAGTMLPLQSYDFWAVGVNCCSGTGADFHCGEYDNPRAAAAMRLMDDSQRPYFRLAVQQAEAAYHIRARHPIFLHWMQDPVAEVERYPAAAHRRFTVCLWSSLALQLFLTAGLAAVVATHSGAP
mmetsp:Transcript_74739/g.241660  ORF Transcript_74739/g.241660 Transcript_74739/m.241660 type:complete len:325 (+) Transcript_74739:118-1092(+)